MPNSRVPLIIKRNSDDTLLKDFGNVFIAQERPAPSVLGIITIPKASIDVTATEINAFEAANHFIVHFPAMKPTIDLVIATRSFNTSTDKVMLDDVEVQSIQSADHPEMPGYRRLTGKVNNHAVFYRQTTRVSLVSGAKRTVIPIHPVATYDPTTNTSKISIVK
jgi:hypothetical protein